ncbi:2'-5' RNA ligase family protein [Streptomyces triticagri]|uniref:2'-5' RNA ligase family protein n=1 Tax=Streptomyces triticagri TaxID=2293568 RepID=UPI001F166CA0|nr:2'-5' RNA ligase family protein [Streptomyces triticagri]
MTRIDRAVPPARPEPPTAASRAAESGWPDVHGDTSLTIRVPEADALVHPGLPPAHVTVLYPFLHRSRIDAEVDRELRELFGAHAPFELSFTRFLRWPGVLYLDPQPCAPVRALTSALTTRWPEARPYRGIFGEGLDPHLTLANHEGPATWRTAYDALESRLAPALPLVSRVAEILLGVFGPDGWSDARSYRLGSASADTPLPRPLPGPAGVSGRMAARTARIPEES